MHIDGRALRWLEAGRGEPAVVLEAGYSDTSLAWARVVPALAAGTRVIAYDRAGLGASDSDVALPTLDRRLSDLAALIEHAAAAPAVLVGHSWGGILVQALACQRPDLAAALVLVDPADPNMLATLPGWARWLARTVVTARIRSPGVQNERRGIVASAPSIEEFQTRCPPPDVPVLVLSAGRGFPRGVRRHWTALQAQVAARARNGRHIVVPESGHAIPQRRPDLVSELTLQLVAGLREAIRERAKNRAQLAGPEQAQGGWTV
jgi:pimeloyl-ACP methyl ester carboxylesterase